MKRICFNKDWCVSNLSAGTAPVMTDLPHDAMISEPRDSDSVFGNENGWYAGYDYQYEKRFHVPEEWKQNSVLLEFEGISHLAEVYLNGQKIKERANDCAGFFADPEADLKYGEENVLQVITHGTGRHSAGHYTGTGLLRPVYLWAGPSNHIIPYGIQVRTVDYLSRKIEVLVRTTGPGRIRVQILDRDHVIASREFQSSKKVIRFPFTLPEARLWDPGTPYLYRAAVTFEEDFAETAFGIRDLDWKRKEGFTVNGRRTVLRGACVYPDNGLLGGCAFPEAEERKAALLKEHGFNAVRCLLFPGSEAFLDACDRLGMLVLDEYGSMRIAEEDNKEDIEADHEWWKYDLRDLIRKKYNHPSLAGYGIGVFRETQDEDNPMHFMAHMGQLIHTLDDTRPVAATSGKPDERNKEGIGQQLFAAFKSMTEGLRSGRVRKDAEEDPENIFAEETGEEITDDSEEAPVNMGSPEKTSRRERRREHKKELENALRILDLWGIEGKPEFLSGIRQQAGLRSLRQKLYLAAAVFPEDAVKLWERSRSHTEIAGAFVWPGMDSPGDIPEDPSEYREYCFDAPEARMTGGTGCFDLTGKPRESGIFLKNRMLQSRDPVIMVRPASRKDAPYADAMAFGRALSGWSWKGWEDHYLIADVYFEEGIAELFLNEKSIGKKKIDSMGKASFRVLYHPGVLKTVITNESGEFLGGAVLSTPSDGVRLQIRQEQYQNPVRDAAAGQLQFFRLLYSDVHGNPEARQRHQLKVEAEGGTLVALGCGNSYVIGNFTDDTTDTYYGEALAVIRAGEGPFMTVRVAEDGEEETVSVTLPVRSRTAEAPMDFFP